MAYQWQVITMSVPEGSTDPIPWLLIIGYMSRPHSTLTAGQRPLLIPVGDFRTTRLRTNDENGCDPTSDESMTPTSWFTEMAQTPF